MQNLRLGNVHPLVTLALKSAVPYGDLAENYPMLGQSRGFSIRADVWKNTVIVPKYDRNRRLLNLGMPTDMPAYHVLDLSEQSVIRTKRKGQREMLAASLDHSSGQEAMITEELVAIKPAQRRNMTSFVQLPFPQRSILVKAPMLELLSKDGGMDSLFPPDAAQYINVHAELVHEFYQKQGTHQNAAAFFKVAGAWDMIGGLHEYQGFLAAGAGCYLQAASIMTIMAKTYAAYQMQLPVFDPMRDHVRAYEQCENLCERAVNIYEILEKNNKQPSLITGMVAMFLNQVRDAIAIFSGSQCKNLFAKSIEVTLARYEGAGKEHLKRFAAHLAIAGCLPDGY